MRPTNSFNNVKEASTALASIACATEILKSLGSMSDSDRAALRDATMQQLNIVMDASAHGAARAASSSAVTVGTSASNRATSTTTPAGTASTTSTNGYQSATFTVSANKPARLAQPRRCDLNREARPLSQGELQTAQLALGEAPRIGEVWSYLFREPLPRRLFSKVGWHLVRRHRDQFGEDPRNATRYINGNATSFKLYDCRWLIESIWQLEANIDENVLRRPSRAAMNQYLGTTLPQVMSVIPAKGNGNGAGNGVAMAAGLRS
jgi:hypothetical protein